MTFLSWFDDRTLLACFCMLVTVFAFMLMAMRAMHPRLPGIGAVTTGFSAGAVATILLFAQGPVPAAFALIGGGGMSLLSSIFIYRGVLQFCQHERPASGAGLLPEPESASPSKSILPLLCAVSLFSFAILVWFTVFSPNEAMRVVAITGTMAFSRWIVSWTILRVARDRVHLLALGVTIGVVALATTLQALRAAVSVSAVHPLSLSHLETPVLLFGVLAASIQGVLFLMMFSGMVTDTIHEQAQLDYLTGVLNRRGIEAALDSEVARTRRTTACFSMLLIDLDHFKEINDRCGHACGDESLRLVTQTVRRSIRIYDRLGRFGGDEFLLLLPQTDGAEAMCIASRIIDEIRKLPPRMKGLPMTVSIGATCCWPGDSPLDVMRRADAALYEAKRTGRDCAQLSLGVMHHATQVTGSPYLPQDEMDVAPALASDLSLPSEA